MSDEESHDAVYGSPAWRGREAFRTFAASVMLDLRYFRSVQGKKFLTDVLASCHARTREVPKAFKWWRARLGCSWVDEVVIAETDQGPVIGDADMPFPAGEMKPPPVNWNSEGRVNPRGISYLYLATNHNTALAEVRPWIGSKVSVGKFVAVRDLTIIDCSVHRHGIIGVLGWGPSASYEDGMWSAIDEAFAKPVGKDENTYDYIPTQILGELFKKNGYSGVVYKSLLDDDGFNTVLFNPDDAKLVSNSLFMVNGVKFDSTDQGCTYYT